jgi:peptidoglycan hydrolase-like protein with peptidoglycan-binding domain
MLRFGCVVLALGLALSACSFDRDEADMRGPSVVDGVMGGNAAAQSGVGRPNVPSAPSHADNVRKVQRSLAALGYEPGPVDGEAGPGTEKAIRRYQADHGLRVDGRVTEKLVAHLEGKSRRQSAKSKKR